MRGRRRRRRKGGSNWEEGRKRKGKRKTAYLVEVYMPSKTVHSSKMDGHLKR